MGTQNYALTSLIDAGADASSNMYDVVFDFLKLGYALTARAGGFDIPEFGVDTYQVKYHGVSYNRIKSEQNFERKFSLTFRMDAAYGLYDTLTKFASYHGDPNTGSVANTNVILGNVYVRAIKVPFIGTAGNGDTHIGTVSGDTTSNLYVEGAEANVDTNNGNVIRQGDNTKSWAFKDVSCIKVGQPKYKTDGSDQLTFQVDFIFGNTKYAGYSQQDDGE